MKSNIEVIFLQILLVFLICFTFVSNIGNKSTIEHYSVQAYSYIHGHLDLISDRREKFLDTSEIDGKIYLWGDPGTGLFMIPFALITSVADQIPPQWPLNILAISVIFLMVISISKHSGVRLFKDKLWYGIAFLFASSMVSIIFVPNTWNLAQVISIALSLIYICEWITKKRPLILLPLILLITITRKQLLLPISLFSALDIIINSKLRKTLKFLVLILIFSLVSYKSLALWKEHYLEGPYREASSKKSYTINYQAQQHKLYGLFNLHYLPRNIYNYFLRGPEPIFVTDLPGSNLAWPYITSPFDGMGFFWLSPIFLSLIFYKFENIRKQIPYLVSAATILLIYLTFFTSGETQFGLRYSADLLPFLLLPFIDVTQNKLNLNLKIILLISILFNIYLFYSFFITGRTV